MAKPTSPPRVPAADHRANPGRGTPDDGPAAPGTFVFAGYNQNGFGNQVLLSHAGEFQTRYAHLSAFGNQKTGAVSGGDTIGFVGSTGTATGPHLHLELLRKGTAVDPAGCLP